MTNYLYLTITLCSILVFTISVIVIYMYFQYKSILTPKIDHFNTYSTHYSEVDITHHYFIYKKIYDVIVKKTDKWRSPFSNFSQKKKICWVHKNNNNLNKTFFSGLDLDFILGRAFLSYQSERKTYRYSIYKFSMKFLPIVYLWCFIIFLILNLIFLGFIQNNLKLIQENNFFNYLYKYHILNLLLVIFWALYIFWIMLNGYIKALIENDYEKDVREFVKTNYQDLYNDWIIARRYSRSINFNYNLGFGFLFKIDHKYLGPFGAI